MIREAHSKALIATDRQELLAYRKEKQRDREINQLKKDLEETKQRINRLCSIIEKYERE
jgi:predicted RNase H-like nuclease (RuvC/YqgF family)